MANYKLAKLNDRDNDEVIIGTSTFTVNQYSSAGTLYLSLNANLLTGKIISIAPGTKTNKPTWQDCYRKAMAACQADPACDILYELVGPECPLAVAIACYISVNNGNAGH